jgi:ribonucleoside-diphosphate reductase alpha chain
MSEKEDMRVIKRSGDLEDLSFDKILNRIKKLGQEVEIQLPWSQLVIKIVDQLHDKISTSQIDELTAQQCASLATLHPDYGILAGRIVISNNQKNTHPCFFNVVEKLYNASVVSKEFYNVVLNGQKYFEPMLDYSRDYLIDYFGFKTLERSYLLKIDGQIKERVQHMWLRVAITIHESNYEAVKETYDLMSQKYFTHATPTLFNSGTLNPQLSSCYLQAMESDSLDGIFNTLHECASISKWAGGVGLHIHNIRGTGSEIKGTNGKSTGIVPMLKVFNDTAKYINQGSRRNGSIAIYLEPWHPDIEDFLELKKNHGDEDMRARDLFYALWIPDLFMERVKANQSWSLFCPNDILKRGYTSLADVYGKDFNKLYTQYEKTPSITKKTVQARDLWFKILDAQMETGTPYILYKDAINRKTNQQNLGTIKSSNLCTEICQYSDDKETSVCNLASIGLPKFVNELTKEFDYVELHKVVKIVTKNLNKIIDINFYPTAKATRSNLLHRNIGIGVQGLSDVFIMMDVAFHSEEAKTINKIIFETIYHAALEQSYELANERYDDMLELQKQIKHDAKLIDKNPDHILYFEKEETKKYNKLQANVAEIQLPEKWAGAYSSFAGSPASNGILQFDMWYEEESEKCKALGTPLPEHSQFDFCGKYDWALLNNCIQNRGLRNSLLIAPMPTASTSQILGYNECFEPLTSNIYNRNTLAGKFTVINKYLIKELLSLGLWNETIKNNIIANKGSVQQLTMLSEHIRNKYKIVWEMPMKHLIDMAADRGRFICQSQSMNLWVEDPNYNTLTSMHFYSWKKGLKTGIYYLRRKAKHQAQQFTIEPEKNNKRENEKNEASSTDEICEMCSA